MRRGMSPQNREHLFKPGQSGNPGGRPKADPEMQAILKAACPKAAAKLVELLDCSTPKIVLSAAEAILNRIYGKPKESVDMNVNQDENLNLQIRGALLEELRKKNDDRECEYADSSECGSVEGTVRISFGD